MKNKIFFIKITLIILIFFNNFAYAFKNRIVASVGSEIISEYELKNKIKIILFFSNQELSQNNINKTKEQAIRSLVDEKLKKEEVLKNKIPVGNNKNVNDYLGKISLKFNTDQSGLKKIFIQNKIDYELYTKEVYTQFAWNQLIFNLYQNKIELNEKGIEEELQKLIKTQKNIIEYNLSQIELSVIADKSKNLEQIKKIKNQIKEIGFKDAALKYSTSASVDGGNIGWVSSKSISRNILNIIKKMQVEEVSEPIFQTDTILFLKLLGKKDVKVDKINYNDMRAKIIQMKKNELLNLFSNNHLSKVKNNALIEIK